MGRLELFQAQLNDILHQAEILTEAAVSLSRSFEAEAERLTREDQVKHLKKIQAEIDYRLAWFRQRESTARSEYTNDRLKWSYMDFAANIFTKVITKKREANDFVNQVFDTRKDGKPPYGNVTVCIGKKGIPEEVEVVSISSLARDANQSEFNIIQQLRKGGCLILSQGAFANLIGKLITDIREGRLCLPITGGQLSETAAPRPLMIQANHWTKPSSSLQ